MKAGLNTPNLPNVSPNVVFRAISPPSLIGKDKALGERYPPLDWTGLPVLKDLGKKLYSLVSVQPSGPISRGEWYYCSDDELIWRNNIGTSLGPSIPYHHCYVYTQTRWTHTVKDMRGILSQPKACSQLCSAIMASSV